MTERQDPIARLEAIGRSSPPAPTTDRQAAIENRVMSAVRGGEATARPDERRTRLAPFVLTAAAVVLLVVIASIVFAAGDGPLRFDVAEGVRLELPDDVVSAEPGDAIPDGAIVDVAPDGVAVVGDDRFGPGRYLVVDGRLTLLPTTTSTTSTTSATSTTDATAVLVDATTVPGRDAVVPATGPRRDRSAVTTIGSTTTAALVDRTTTVPTRPTTVPARPTRPTTVPDRTTTTNPGQPADRPTTTAAVRDTRPPPVTDATIATGARPDVTTTTTRDSERDERP